MYYLNGLNVKKKIKTLFYLKGVTNILKIREVKVLVIRMNRILELTAIRTGRNHLEMTSQEEMVKITGTQLQRNVVDITDLKG